MAMLDHVTIGVTDLARSRDFYDATLAPIGITRMAAEGDRFAGYGADGRAFFWIGLRQTAIGSAHIAFAVADRRSVDHFHAAGVAAGGRDHGAPGLRPHYHARYYGAFILDPDGHNIEAVCHAAA
jgi:catechol 2,3-dioxygenase-like lactoylglutathione lyase family enzyme